MNQRAEAYGFWPTLLWSHWENGCNKRPPNKSFVPIGKSTKTRAESPSLYISLFRRCNLLAYNQFCRIFPLQVFRHALFAHHISLKSLWRVNFVYVMCIRICKINGQKYNSNCLQYYANEYLIVSFHIRYLMKRILFLQFDFLLFFKTFSLV